jgi:hypothetical protein
MAVPTSADTVFMNTTTGDSIIDSGYTATIDKMYGPGNGGLAGVQTLDINEGTLNVLGPFLSIAHGGPEGGGEATVNVINNATLNNNADMYVGNYGNGTLNIGTLGGGDNSTVTTNKLLISTKEVSNYGHVYLYSGLLDTVDLTGYHTDNDILVDIYEGTFIVRNKTGGPIQEGWIDKGYIIAYGGAGTVVHTVSPEGWDVLTAIGNPNIAWNPSPEDMEEDVDPDADLSWSSGDTAVFHEVYFGTSEIDVTNATDPNTPPGRGRQAANSYEPGTLDLGTTYYWRIDEVNEAHGDSPWKGLVWSFTTRNWEAVDDFDSYVDQTAMRVVWHDYTNGGTNASVDVESNPDYVCDGNSMNFEYFNTGSPKYSEAWANTTGTNSLGIGTDWTRDDLKTLVVNFYGLTTNTAQPLYVVLEDSVPNVGVVTYDDANAVLQEQWHEWNIELQDFSDSGVILTDVQKVYLGVGVRGETVVDGGIGNVYFDDVRLYLTRCLYPPVMAKGNLNNDCVIDFKDFAIMAGYWLKSGMWP